MAEQTLNNPLTGAEVIEAVVDKLREKLKRDCYLNPNSAYDYFTAHVSIDLQMHDAGADVKVTAAVDLENGIVPEAEVETVIADLDITPAPPNQVRVETGQPVPVLAKGERGESVIKPVRYGRNKARAAS